MPIKLHLESVPIFQFLDPDDLQRLTPLGKAISKGKGEALLLHGESVPGIYIIGEGACGVYPQGATKPLTIIEAGGSFGEMSFLEKSKASATIRAETATTKLVVFMHSEVQKLVDDDAKIGRALFRGIAVTLSQKLRSTNDRISRELKECQRFLPDMSRGQGATPFLDNLEKLIKKEAEISEQQLKFSLATLDELNAKNPDTIVGLTSAKAALIETNRRVQTFTPQLLSQIETMTKFIKGVTDLLL